jgi:hypothetical protein
MDDSALIPLTGCERLGVFDLSPTSGTQKDLRIKVETCKYDGPPKQVRPHQERR